MRVKTSTWYEKNQVNAVRLNYSIYKIKKKNFLSRKSTYLMISEG